MAIIVEAISVIVLTAAIETKYPDGWEGFVEHAPNQTLVSDGEIARLGFMNPAGVEAFVESLKVLGFKFDEESQTSEVCVVDQLKGKLSDCEWLAVGTTSIDGNESHKISAAMRVGSEIKQVITPDGWTYKDSLSSKHTYVPTGDVSSRLRYLRSVDGLDIFWDEDKGKEVFAPVQNSQ
jgi:hypothetical protein